VIRLGLRLTLRGGKEAAARLIVTAVAVALGVGLLLIALACMDALNAQNARAKWLDTGEQATVEHATGSQATPTSTSKTADPLWWLLTTDQFGNQTIDRVDLAATGPSSPVPPGITHLPGPGQYYVSPALGKLLSDTPAPQLRDRFPGKQIGTIGDSALTGPNALVIAIGHRAGQLSHALDAKEVTSIETPATEAGGAGVENSTTLDYIFIAAACALLFPVLIFISTATRLAAARREQRFAAMRLVGATPRQVSVIAAVEAAVAALGGVAIGFGLFFLLRPALATVDFTGAPFFPGDLSLSRTDILLTALGIPAAAAVAARIALRRVQISPLGVIRRVTPRAPRAWRVIPLLAGIAELGYFAIAGHPGTTGGQAGAFFLGFLLLMAGLISAGPWLTMVGSRIMARRTSRPAVLIAGRRLSDNPRAAFRAISGLILALFVTGVAIGVITTLVADHGGGGTASSTLAADTLVDDASYYAAPGQAATATDPIPDAVLTQLREIRGVQGVTVIRAAPLAPQNADPYKTTALVACAQLAQTPALGRCPPGADVASVKPDFSGGVKGVPSLRVTVWPAATTSLKQLQKLPVQLIVVGTNGSAATIEQARTVLDLASPYLGSPATLDERNAAVQSQIAEWQREAEVVIIASLPIAGCSLAVSVAAGLTDRKRPFSLLRLTGVPLGVLRSVVALESAVPLVLIALISAGTGLLGAALFLRSQFDVSLRSPGTEYYLVVVAGLVASLGIIALTLPLLERITGPEIARNE
jgi:hypothetical protein